LVQKLLNDSQEEVRLSTGMSLCEICALLKQEDRGKHALTLVLQLAHDDEQEELRMTAAKLLNDLVESLGKPSFLSSLPSSFLSSKSPSESHVCSILFLPPSLPFLPQALISAINSFLPNSFLSLKTPSFASEKLLLSPCTLPVLLLVSLTRPIAFSLPSSGKALPPSLPPSLTASPPLLDEYECSSRFSFLTLPPFLPPSLLSPLLPSPG
jgi:hypothetical protein